MSMPLDFTHLITLGLEAQSYFFEHFLVWNMVVQLIVVGFLYLLARLTAEAVRPRLRSSLARHAWIEHSLPHLTKVFITRLLSPIIMLVLLWIAYRTTRRFHWPDHGIRLFLSLVLAWVVIRLSTSQMRNRTLARIVTVAIWSVAALDILHLLLPLMALLDSIDLTISNVHLTLLSIIEGILILVVLFWLSKKISVLFEHWIKTVEHITPSVQVLLYKLLTLALFTLVIVGVLYYLGINLTAFAIFSGALGLGVGFGLQKILANLISGLIILADKSIKPGDVIQLGDTHGWINYLGGRYVSVVTRDATEYLIPNEDLITTQVINWSYSNNLVRLKIPVGIAYGSDLKQAMELMLAAAAAVPRILADPQPVCLLLGFGDNSVDFQLRVWIHDPQAGVTNVKSQVLLGVWESFQQHGIELPFPQRVLHHKSVPGLEVAIHTQDRAAGAEAVAAPKSPTRGAG
jgi:small-conductance mechanosensitive channel